MSGSLVLATTRGRPSREIQYMQRHMGRTMCKPHFGSGQRRSPIRYKSDQAHDTRPIEPRAARAQRNISCRRNRIRRYFCDDGPDGDVDGLTALRPTKTCTSNNGLLIKYQKKAADGAPSAAFSFVIFRLTSQEAIKHPVA